MITMEKYGMVLNVRELLERIRHSDKTIETLKLQRGAGIYKTDFDFGIDERYRYTDIWCRGCHV